MGWFVLKNRMLQGPFSDDQLLDACLKGRYTRGDYVISTENAEKGVLKYLRLNEIKRTGTDALLLPPAAPGSTQFTAAGTPGISAAKTPNSSPERPLERTADADKRQGPQGDVTRMFAAALEAADLVSAAPKETKADLAAKPFTARVVSQGDAKKEAAAVESFEKIRTVFLQPGSIFVAVLLFAAFVFFNYLPQGVAWREAFTQHWGGDASRVARSKNREKSRGVAATSTPVVTPASTVQRTPRLPPPTTRQQEYIPPPPAPPEEPPPPPREDSPPPVPDPATYARPQGIGTDPNNPNAMIDPETGQALPQPWPAQPQIDGAPQPEPSY